MADWTGWHAQYEDPSSPLSQRLAAVQLQIALALDRAAPGPMRLLSLCAGQGRDVLPVLATHSRGRDVRGRLVEFDPGLAAAARAAAPPSIEVLTADAGTPAAHTDAVPVDLLLLCGIFGNVPDEDVERTVTAVPSLSPPVARWCGPGTGASPTSRHRCGPGSPRPAWRKPRSSPRQGLGGRWEPACCRFHAAGRRPPALHVRAGQPVTAAARHAPGLISSSARFRVGFARFRAESLVMAGRAASAVRPR